MLEFFSKLLSTEGFMPHGHCYLWAPGPFWLTVLADGMIALAYFSIPFLLISFVRRRPEVLHRELFGWFAAFILLCGISHVFSIIGMWKPFYRLEGITLLATGLVSVVTTIKLGLLIPTLVKIPTPEVISTEKSGHGILLTRGSKNETTKVFE